MTTVIGGTTRLGDVSDDADISTFAIERSSCVAALTANDSSIGVAPEVISARIDEAEIPDWVYRRFSSAQWSDAPSAQRIRRSPSPRTVPRDFPTPVGEPTVSDQVCVALARSGYPLQRVRCWNDDQTLALFGFVTRYFYKQMAVEVAQELANGRRIEVHIEVNTAPAS